MKLITNKKTYKNVEGIINSEHCYITLDKVHDIELGDTIRFVTDIDEELCTLKKEDYKVWECVGNTVHWDKEEAPAPYEPTMEELRSQTINSLNNSVEQTIYVGVDVKTSYGDEHFSLTANDQANIGNIFNAVVMGVEEFPYHADGKECVIYPKADIVSLYVNMQTLITKLTTHGNLLKQYVNSCEDKDAVKAVTLATELTGELAEQEIKVLASAKAQMDAMLAKLA
nr:MAG TPA: protein of unknown function DUF4376 [Caudoviricetes sp.]